MSNCDIDLDFDDEEYIDTIEYEDISTKDIRCIECKRIIPSNTIFNVIQINVYMNDNFDDLIETKEYKTCVGCTQVKKIFFTSHYTFGWVWQDIWDYCFDNNEFPESKFQLLGPEGKEIFLQEWEKYHAD